MPDSNENREHTWIVRQYSRKALSEKRTISSIFQLGDFKWKLTLMPKGVNPFREQFQTIALRCLNLENIPMDQWPRATVHITAVNISKPNLSLRKTTKHTFCAFYEEVAITKFLAIRENGVPTVGGFLVNDSIRYKVEIEIRTRNSTNRKMTSLPSKTHKESPLKIRICDELFEIKTDDLERFPNSLLYWMTQEFPNLIDNGEELRIDRDPNIFLVINDIYSKGYHSYEASHVASQDLQRELDFFQLPSAIELGISIRPMQDLVQPVYRDMESLFAEIMEEMGNCKLKDKSRRLILPYTRARPGSFGWREGERRILVLPAGNSLPGNLIRKRGHADFVRALCKGTHLASESSLGIELSPTDSIEKFVIAKYSCGSRMQYLNRFAYQKKGFGLEICKYFFGSENSKLQVELLRFT